jgi:uroporphyrinogen decarboxylase
MRNPWKGTMTQRERFYNQMHYLPFDRTVNMEFGYWDENYKEWKMFTKNGITNETKANEFFTFDDLSFVGSSG